MDILEKEYCKMHGWIRKKGIMIETVDVTEYDNFFVPDDCADDYYKECSMWCDENYNDTGVYDDEDIIEHIEEYADVDFKEWKRRMKEKIK